MTPEQQVCATSRCRHSCLTRCFWSLGMVLLLGAYLTRETVRGPLYTAKACQMNTLGSKPSLLQTEVRPSAYGRCRRMACGNALPRWHQSQLFRCVEGQCFMLLCLYPMSWKKWTCKANAMCHARMQKETASLYKDCSCQQAFETMILSLGNRLVIVGFGSRMGGHEAEFAIERGRVPLVTRPAQRGFSKCLYLRAVKQHSHG